MTYALTSRFLLSLYVTVCSASLISLAEPAHAQYYNCSEVALGTNTYQRDVGYQQNNNGSLNQTDIQSQTQSASRQNNQMNTTAAVDNGSSSQQINNSGSSASGNTFSDATTNSSSRSRGQSTSVAGNYGFSGGSFNHSSNSSLSNSNSQSNSGSSSNSLDYNRNQSYQNNYNSQNTTDGSHIDQNFADNTTMNNQSSSGTFNQDRKQNDYTQTGTTVVGTNCDTAVQAESARDREMIRQRAAVEQERVRLQRDQMRQRSSDDFMNRPW